jgi:hypothetical protein
MEGSIDQAGQAIFLDGPMKAMAEFAHWWRKQVPIAQPLIMYDEGYNGAVNLAEDTTVADIISTFSLCDQHFPGVPLVQDCVLPRILNRLCVVTSRSVGSRARKATAADAMDCCRVCFPEGAILWVCGPEGYFKAFIGMPDS